MLKEVEWGNFKLGDLFEKTKVKKLKYKATQLPSTKDAHYCLPALTAGIQNQGLNNYVPKEDATILKDVISISANGANTGATFFQSKEFTVLQDSYAINWIKDETIISEKAYLFITSAISKVIFGKYEWTNKAGWEKIKNEKIKLPIKNDEIDFDFMENIINEIQNNKTNELDDYLKVTGLDDYNLTNEELDALNNYNNLDWNEFNLFNLYGASSRGKRLKSADRIDGTLPFVTAGENDEGISAFIGNTVTIFKKNSITIDMFGSAKYRNYDYGCDDHVTVVDTEKVNTKDVNIEDVNTEDVNTEDVNIEDVNIEDINTKDVNTENVNTEDVNTEKIDKYATIFLTTAIHKASYTGVFHYGRNFYPKDADALNVRLPIKNNDTTKPDYDAMSILISAIQKLVIKDVVLDTKKKINATKTVVKK